MCWRVVIAAMLCCVCGVHAHDSHVTLHESIAYTCDVSGDILAARTTDEALLRQLAYDWAQHKTLQQWHYTGVLVPEEYRKLFSRPSSIPFDSCVRVIYTVPVHTPRALQVAVSSLPSVTFQKTVCISNNLSFEHIVVKNLPLIGDLTIHVKSTFENGEMHSVTTTDADVHWTLMLLIHTIKSTITQSWHEKNMLLARAVCA